MKKFLLFCAVLVFVVLFVASMSGCGGSGALPTPTPTSTPTPTPTPTLAETTNWFAFLRNDGTASSSAAPITWQQRQAARRAAKFAHATRREQAVTPPDSGPVNVYLITAKLYTDGSWSPGSERKITGSAAAYTSVHLSPNGTSYVFSATINGFNQILTSTVPKEGQTAGEPLQVTTDLENHWLPHISADGSQVVFTKADPNSTGDVVCFVNNTAGATESCLDFSSSTPALKGAKIWHASWAPDSKIVFEAWAGPLNSDDIYMVKVDGSGLARITNNTGTKNYDECPSISSSGTYMAVDTWHDTTAHYGITVIDLATGQRFTYATGTDGDAWDPLRTAIATVWVSRRTTDRSQELYTMGFGPVRLTNNTYDDYFENTPK